MLLTVVSSLDVLCRQRACEMLAAAHPAAALVVHDLLDDGVVVRRVFGPGAPVDRAETRLEHGCLSCTVRLDVVPTVERLLGGGVDHIVIALPPSVPAIAAVNALKQGLAHPFTVGSVMLACAPDSLEDHIWDHHTLFESGFTPTPEDQRTPGEFLIGELAFSDTILLADPLLVPVNPDQRARGVQLLDELAPHARITDGADADGRGSHNYSEAVGRTNAGSVRTPAQAPASPFVTVTQSVQRPLHAERFRDALATLAEGCCWLRGRLWIATAPDCRIAIQGIGPRVWLENTGSWPADQTAQSSENRASDRGHSLDWHPDHGDRGTVIAATGEHLDPAEFARLLEECQLTDAEMDASPADLPDPFDFSLTS